MHGRPAPRTARVFSPVFLLFPFFFPTGVTLREEIFPHLRLGAGWLGVFGFGLFIGVIFVFFLFMVWQRSFYAPLDSLLLFFRLP